MSEFCEQCGSLYNHIISDGILSYDCQVCGNKKPVDKPCIMINEITQTARDYPISPNIIYDNTLPRTRKYMCPKCKKNTELVIFQYNPEIYNVGYMCTECRYYWKN